MARKMEMKALADKYRDFGNPAAKVSVAGKEVGLREGLYLESAEVVSGVGRDPDMAVLTYRADRSGPGCISALESVLDLGEKVEVRAGYGDALERIFLGYLHEAEVSAMPDGYAEYTLICLDVKGLMKKNNSFRASGRKKVSQIMDDILGAGAYAFLVEKKNTDSLPEAFNQDCVIRGESDYEWMCSLAEYLDYEFYCCRGELSFCRAGKDAPAIVELSGEYGLLSAKAVVTMAGQYGSVQVGGYNRKDEKIRGTDTWKKASGPFLGKAGQKLHGCEKALWDMELETAAQAAARAKAVMGSMVRQCSRMEAAGIGIPELRPGVCAGIAVKGMDSLSGIVYVEEVRHVLDWKGYRMTLKGRRV